MLILIKTFMIIKIFLLSWTLTHFSPLKMISEYLLSKTKDNPMASIIMSITTLPIYCLMCCSFWCGLIISGDIFIASGAAFIGFWYDKLLSSRENFEVLM